MYESILLPVDLNHESSWNRAAPEAVALAKQHGAKIHVLTVIPDYGMAVVGGFFPADYADKAVTASESAMAKFVAEHIPGDVQGGSTAVSGTIYKRILVKADELDSDLIVMASHRPSKADYLLGPNAARVVRHAKQSVFIVRP